MAFITFIKQWDRFNPDDTRYIESTLAARLIQSGIAKPFERQKVETVQIVDHEPAIVPDVVPIEVKPKPKRKKTSDKRLKPSQKKGK